MQFFRPWRTPVTCSGSANQGERSINIGLLKKNAILSGVAWLIAVICFTATPCRAQSSLSFATAVEHYFIDWFPRVTKIQSEQPHWANPLVTTSPRLEEQVRYDQFWQANPHGIATDNFGAGKGLELIPFQNTEVILGVPAWIAYNGHIVHSTTKKVVATDGWEDETFLIKYRLLSANEEAGNYIVTAFMGFSAPTGTHGNSSGHALFTPTLAAW